MAAAGKIMKADFDRRARGWDTDPAKVERAQVVAQAIRAAIPLPPGISLLEYGCGTGLLSFALQPFPGRMTLADNSPGMLRQLRAKIKAGGIDNMTVLQLDLSADPLPSERYDLVCLLMVLHHLPDTGRILGQFHEILTPGGHLCIADLDREDGSFHGPLFTGQPGFEPEALQTLLEQAGFRSVSFQDVYKVSRAGRIYPLFLATAARP